MDETIYFTFDMDWANDVVLEYFYSLLKKYDIPATIFVTHDTDMLQKFRQDEKIELGIHPNFNRLLNGDNGQDNYKIIVDNMLEIVPEATAYRSHALVDFSPLTIYCEEKGLERNLNMYMFPEEGSRIYPFKRGGVTMIPFIFEDDLWLMYGKKDIEYLLEGDFKAHRIFNFHPIHLFLNCESLSRYENAKKYNKTPEELQKYRNDMMQSEGVEDIFVKLIQMARNKGWSFGLIRDLEGAVL